VTLLTYLATLTPTQLRAQLREPDPVQMHDWNVTAHHYKAAVKVALIAKDRRYD
jgi:hypothetical protein